MQLLNVTTSLNLTSLQINTVHYLPFGKVLQCLSFKQSAFIYLLVKTSGPIISAVILLASLNLIIFKILKLYITLKVVLQKNKIIPERERKKTKNVAMKHQYERCTAL